MNIIFRILLLLFKNTEEDDSIEDNNLVLVPEIPFYGKAGTICRIEEDDESYYKVLYNQDGSIKKQKVPVPKKKTRNLNSLLDDYISDVDKYIKIYNKEYSEYVNVNPLLKKSEYYILITITILAVILSIPFLLTNSTLGLIFSTVSVLFLYILINIRKKDIKIEKKNTNFLSQYQVLSELLYDYKNGKSILNKTKNTIYKQESNLKNAGLLNKLLTINNYKEVS